MQAVIMAGGKGTRLRELTKDLLPKPMVQVLGKPILLHQVECLKRQGVRDITLIVGYLGEKIEEYFKDGSDFDVRISYIREETPLGTAGALALLPPMLKEDEFFLVFGDVLFDIDLNRMAQFHREHKAEATLFVHPNSHPYDSDLVVVSDEGRVSAFNKKNETRNYWYSNCVNAGFYLMNKSACDRIKEGVKTDLEKELLSGMIADGRSVYAYRSPEYIKDIGTPERIKSAQNDMMSGLISARNLKNKQRAIFLDRDGTINRKDGLIYQEERFELEETATEAIKAINASGYLAIVVTNQPVVARGLCSLQTVEVIHKKMETLLGREGAYLDAIMFCPHHPDKGYPDENPEYKIPCRCRKPDIGMLKECIAKYNIDLSASWIIGDTTTDIKTGINAGCKTTLVLTGEAGKDGKYNVTSDLIGNNLLDAVEKILGRKSMNDYKDEINAYLHHEIKTLCAINVDDINNALNLLLETMNSGNTVYVFGNGGSSATASHFQNDFNKGISEHTEKKFNFLCLNDNAATVMAVANDIGFDEVFRFQLRGHIKAGDVVLAISGSGNSKNVLNAVEYAKEQGNKIIGLTGFDGGKLKKLSDVSLHVPINSMQITEDIHMVLDHLMMSIFYRNLCGIEHIR